VSVGHQLGGTALAPSSPDVLRATNASTTAGSKARPRAAMSSPIRHRQSHAGPELRCRAAAFGFGHDTASARSRRIAAPRAVVDRGRC